LRLNKAGAEMVKSSVAVYGSEHAWTVWDSCLDL